MQVSKYFPHLLDASLRAIKSRGKVRLILGARQTGKSCLLQNLEKSPAVSIDLQDVRLRQAYERAPGALSGELEARRERRLMVLIDEIQKVPSLLEEIQFLQDKNPGRFEFFLTGSSARRLRRGAANLLPGRAHALRLTPVILPERSGWKGSTLLPSMHAPDPRRGFPWLEIEDLLLWGSLPGIAAEPLSRRAATLETYTQVYLEEEIRSEAVVRDLGSFSRFLELAALESGQVMNLTKLSQESGIPLATVRTFYQVLEDTFVGYWIPTYGQASRKKVLSTARFVWFDTGVRNAAARLPLERGLLKTAAGPLFEQWVLAELVHRVSYLGRSCRVSFWRTRHGVEVDAIVETPKRDIPVEVKWTSNPQATDARHLEFFLDTFPKRAREGFVICRVPHARKLTDRVTALPWSLM